jgi:hypothetical protein
MVLSILLFILFTLGYNSVITTEYSVLDMMAVINPKQWPTADRPLILPKYGSTRTEY